MRYQVWIQSGKKYVIEKQSPIELEIIMRAIFLQYSLNQDKDFGKQINYLNKLDEIRGTNWKKTFPEIVELLKDYV